jgi:hypothetical protein
MLMRDVLSLNIVGAFVKAPVPKDKIIDVKVSGVSGIILCTLS